MKRGTQLVLSSIERVSLSHGGGLRKGQRKIARPLATRRPIHITLRAEKARGKLSFHYGNHPKLIHRLLHSHAKACEVRVLRLSNNGNHLHLVLQGHTRAGLKKFLRVLPGQIAQKINRAYKGRALIERFWDEPLFSRIVEWGKAFIIAMAYVRQNQLEALGLAPYRPRRHQRKKIAVPLYGTPSPPA